MGQPVKRLMGLSRGRKNSKKDGGSENQKKSHLRGIIYKNQTYLDDSKNYRMIQSYNCRFEPK